jgi:hypothetical protein
VAYIQDDDDDDNNNKNNEVKTKDMHLCLPYSVTDLFGRAGRVDHCGGCDDQQQ